MMHASDRAKRKAIVIATTYLPKPLRIAVREALLSRLEIARAQRSKLFIIGHPKSGNTWLRTMISRVYQVRHGLPASLILKSDELANQNPAIPRFLVTNGHYSYEGVIEKALDYRAPAAEFADRKIVLLARHPSDIAVSWYFQFTKRISSYKRELINHGLRRPIDPESVTMWGFVMNSEIGLASLIEYLNRWEHNLRGREHSLIIRYEDRRADPGATLKQILTFFGEPYSEAEIEEAVDFTSFDKLKQLESQGFFRHGGMSLRRGGDPDAFKLRRGKVQGYRDYFSAEQLAQMDEMVATRLSPVFGYGGETGERVRG
jgi:hypothetical protein